MIQDYIAGTEEDELSRRGKYLDLLEKGVIDKNRIYHIDIPLTIEHEVAILENAGFSSVSTERMGEKYVNIIARPIGSPAI